MEKAPSATFYYVLIGSHENMKLQSFESSGSDIILANEQSITSLVFFFFVSFVEKEKEKF